MNIADHLQQVRRDLEASVSASNRCLVRFQAVAEYVRALEAVATAAQAVYDNDDFVCAPNDASHLRDQALGEALRALAEWDKAT